MKNVVFFLKFTYLVFEEIIFFRSENGIDWETVEQNEIVYKGNDDNFEKIMPPPPSNAFLFRSLETIHIVPYV